MIRYTTLVRANTPQDLVYTFKTSANVVIPLTGYTGVFLELKRNGTVYETVTAAFTIPKTTGEVSYTGYTFLLPGTWNAQFYCTLSSTKFFGEPVQVVVVPNVEDLTLTQPMVY